MLILGSTSLLGLAAAGECDPCEDPCCKPMVTNPADCTCSAAGGSCSSPTTSGRRRRLQDSEADGSDSGSWEWLDSNSDPEPEPEPSPPPPPAKSVSSRLTLDKDIGTIGEGSAARKAFEDAFRTDLATLLGNITKTRVVITSIKAGSIVVDFYVLADSSGKALTASSLTTAFKSSGVSIGGAKSTAAITSSDITTTPEPSDSSQSDEFVRDVCDGTSWGVIAAVFIGFTVCCIWMQIMKHKASDNDWKGEVINNPMNEGND